MRKTPWCIFSFASRINIDTIKEEIVKKIFFMFFIICFSVCFYAAPAREIPFYIDSYFDIYLKVSDNKSQYKFLLDTGSTKNVLFKQGYDKFKKDSEQDLDEVLFKMIKDCNQDVPDEQIYQFVYEYLKNNIITFTFDDLRLLSEHFLNREFIYNAEDYASFENNEFDGIIGLSFFDINSNITIDYIDKKIIIDGDLLPSSSVPMKRLETTQLYTVDAKINNVEQEALIDTGSIYFFLRPEYKSSKVYTEEDLLNLSNDKLPKYRAKKKKEQKVILEVGEVKESITGHFIEPEKYSHTKEGESFALRINLLGNQFFINHKIQLDFENMEFRIE